MKKIAICMTVYNRETDYVPTLKNLFEQSYRYVNFFVVDDSSTDGTLNNLFALASNAPEVFHLYKTKEHNYIDAMNMALRSVPEDCEYIVWCDSDDFVSNEKLVMQAQYLNENPDIDVVACTTAFGKNQVLAPSRMPMSHDDIHKMIKEGNGMNTVCHFQSCMFRRSVLDVFADNVYFYPEYIGGRAGEGFLYTLLFSGKKFASINTCAYFYNIGTLPNSMTNTLIPVFANEINTLGYKEKSKTILSLLRKYNKKPKKAAPKTDAPTTEAPVAEAPVTEAPVTEKSKTTRKPRTKKTEAPVTEAPATEKPKTTRKPRTKKAEAPATEKPKTTRKPRTKKTQE